MGQSKTPSTNKSEKGITGDDTANEELFLWSLTACSSRTCFFELVPARLDRAFLLSGFPCCTSPFLTALNVNFQLP
jgi:hypothetical protein